MVQINENLILFRLLIVSSVLVLYLFDEYWERFSTDSREIQRDIASSNPGDGEKPKKKKKKKKKSKKSLMIFCLKAGSIGLGVTAFIVYSFAVAAADPTSRDNWVYV